MSVMAAGLISTQCAGSMHLHCTGCACSVCHNICTECGQDCRSVYTLPHHEKVREFSRGNQVCSACYLYLTRFIPRGQGCEDCGGSTGYRNVGDPSNTFRCIACHAVAGTQAVDRRFHM